MLDGDAFEHRPAAAAKPAEYQRLSLLPIQTPQDRKPLHGLQHGSLPLL
jgi:hypothetical protein